MNKQTFMKRMMTYTFALLLSVIGSMGFAVLNGQKARAEDLPVIYKSGTLSVNETWSAGSVYVVSRGITVPNDVTLTIEAGAIVKFGGGSSIDVSGGTLHVNGTSTNNVILTSYSDDSVGGDSTGDGNHTPSIFDYGAAITLDGGSVDVAFAHFYYGQWGMDSITTGGTATFTDSVFEGAGGIRSFYPINLERNTFKVVASGAINADYSVDVTGIILSGPNKNIFIGSGAQSLIDTRQAKIPAGKIWNVDSGVTIFANYDFEVNGTLNLGPGALIKVQGGGDGVTVNNGGSLISNGTANDPVTITSYNDDSIGGDSTGNGNGLPSAGDYNSAIFAQTGSQVNIRNTNIYYATNAFELSGKTQIVGANIANVINGFITYYMQGDFQDVVINNVTTGISVRGNSQLVFRGNFQNVSDKAIRSCNWGDGCSIDAAYTDWGSAAGPFQASGNTVCGQVTVSPWINGPATSSDIFAIKNCNGSPNPEEQLNDTIQRYQQLADSRQIQCDEGFEDVCQQISRTFACVDAAVGLAMSNSPFPTPGSSPSETAGTFIGDYTSASSTYVNGIEEAAPAAFSLNVANQLTSVLGIFSALNNAYNNCN